MTFWPTERPHIRQPYFQLLVTHLLCLTIAVETDICAKVDIGLFYKNSTLNRNAQVRNIRIKEPLCFIPRDSYIHCCSPTDAYNLYMLSETEFNDRWSKELHDIFEATSADSAYLNDVFIWSLNTTMMILHSTFKKSFQYNYELNQDFFFRFFDGLKSYMLGKKQNLSHMIDMFFRELLTRVVRLMLFANSENDVRTADCVAEGLHDQNPFDQTPEVIKALMIRAYPPARISANALLLARKLFSSLLNQKKLREDCSKSWLKLRYCSLCSGIIQPSICPRNCHWAFTSCLDSIHSIALKWTEFIDKLLPVLAALQGPTSFPRVNRPVQIHMTDGIMNLQRLFSRLDQTLLVNCSHQGADRLSRHRRSDIMENLALQSNIPLPHIGILEEWSRKAVKKYSLFRESLISLPFRLCDDNFLRNERSLLEFGKLCWDGEHMIDGSRFGNAGDRMVLKPTFPHETKMEGLAHQLQLMNRMLDSIIRQHADPDYLPISASDAQRHHKTHISWTHEQYHADPVRNRKLETITVSDWNNPPTSNLQTFSAESPNHSYIAGRPTMTSPTTTFRIQDHRFLPPLHYDNAPERIWIPAEAMHDSSTRNAGYYQSCYENSIRSSFWIAFILISQSF